MVKPVITKLVENYVENGPTSHEAGATYIPKSTLQSSGFGEFFKEPIEVTGLKVG